MRVPARDGAKRETGPFPVAGRNVTNPVERLKLDRFFAAAALLPHRGLTR
jgi:hypothetical protein